MDDQTPLADGERAGIGIAADDRDEAPGTAASTCRGLCAWRASIPRSSSASATSLAA